MLLEQKWFALAALLSSSLIVSGANKTGDDLTAEKLYRLTNIWNVQLKLSADAWADMEPEGGGFFGGGGRPGGPGGPGGGPGGPPPFGPSMFVAPAFLRDGDANADGRLSKAEFESIGTKWFAAWDKEKTGALKEEQLREGLNAMAMPPGGGPGRPPGPGGRGGGFAMNLQGAEGKRNGVASAAGVEFDYVKGEFDFEGRALTNVAIRYKGNGTFMASRGGEKRSFKIDLNDFAKGQKLAGLTKINLHNNVTDPSWMSEVLSHRLFRDGGVPAPRTAYAKVSVDVPGKHDKKYFGLYSLVENVDEDFAKANFGSKKGAIFKPVTPRPFEYLGDDWSKYNQTYDPKGNVTAAQKNRIIELCKLVSQGSDEEFNAKISGFIDLDEFSRYMAVLVFLVDLDGILGPGQNFYVHLHPETQKLAFIPWDLDNSFGRFGMRGTQEQREQLSIVRPWQGERKFLERMFKHDEFKKLYRARLEEFNKTIFKPERFHQQVDELAKLLRPAVEAESAERLEMFNKVAAGEAVASPMFGRGPGRGGPGGGGPMGFPQFQPPKPIKPYVEIRAKSIADQLAGKSEGQVIPEFGGGPGGPGRGFGPGMFLAGAFMTALDNDKNGQVAKDEMGAAFAKWFKAWNKDGSAEITEEELRAGIDRDLAPQFPGPGGPGGPPGFRPPGPPPGNP